jgi:DNA polymerase-3 subunit gamma/tau
MSYQVIARKYRPQKFADVVGQEHVTQTLANAIRSGRVAHAYLFCGPRGTGKTTIARIFAKALNCTNGPNADFDDNDPRCREIAEGRSLDVFEIDGASNNSVDQIRELRETARFAPAASRFKIYIIDEVHMLTQAAFNALLKTLEEPPSHVKFLFATTDPDKVLPTILSRCQRFDLRRIPSPLIVAHLAGIARTEGVRVDEAALHAIARGADGGMRDAESTLDQLISFCGEAVEESDVLAMFGLAARSQILALSRGILEADATTVLHELHELARNGKDLGRLLNDLLRHFRNLMVVHLAPSHPSLLDVTESEAAELKQQASLAPPDAVTRVLEVLTTAEGQFRDAIARKIFLEVTFLKAIQARNAVSLDAVLKQLERLGHEAGGTGSPPEVSTPTASPKAPKPAPKTAAAASPPSSSAPTPPTVPVAMPSSAPTADVQPGALWDQIVSGASPLTRAALAAAQPQTLANGVLTVAYPAFQESQRIIVDQDHVRRAVEARMQELGVPGKVRFVRLADDSAPSAKPESRGEAATPSPAAPPGRPSEPPPGRTRPEKVTPLKVDPAEFRNDPLIREALELFKGQLVDLRPSESG